MSQLTEREVQVLRLVADGYTNQAIADVLYLGVETVRTHVVRLRRKLCANDRAHAVSRGFELGILRVEAADTPVTIPVREQRWANATREKFRSEVLREYRHRRREFAGVPGATQAGSRALWRLADLYPQAFRALVADELGWDEQRDAA